MSKKYSYESESSENSTNTNIIKEKPNSPQILNYKLIKAISITLTSILDSNKNLENYDEIIKTQSRIVFYSNIIPNISLEDYLIRIQNYTNIEKSTLIISLIYIDRLCNKAKITLTYYNIYRILFSAIILSIKYNEDCFYDNKYYAEIFGVKKHELKNFEYSFMKMVNCQLYISKEIYDKYRSYLDNFNFDE